jgi:hypothetical protein
MTPDELIQPEQAEPILAEGPVVTLKIKLIAAAVLLILLVGVVVFVMRMTKDDPQEAARKEAEEVVAAVSKLMVLPADEEPIIATVADPAQLMDQPFFKNASKGDKVLIYNNAKKAILYSPEQNLVVDVAPLSVGTPTPAPKK